MSREFVCAEMRRDLNSRASAFDKIYGASNCVVTGLLSAQQQVADSAPIALPTRTNRDFRSQPANSRTTRSSTSTSSPTRTRAALCCLAARSSSSHGWPEARRSRGSSPTRSKRRHPTGRSCGRATRTRGSRASCRTPVCTSCRSPRPTMRTHCTTRRSSVAWRLARSARRQFARAQVSCPTLASASANASEN